MFNLSRVIDWETDFEGCGATEVRLCEDIDCATAEIDKLGDVFLVEATTKKSNVTGLLHPMLVIKSEEYYETTVYLIAETNNLDTKAVVPIEIMVGELEVEVLTAVATLSNTLPVFEEALEPVLEVKVVVDAAGDILEPTKFRYVSPVATDEEGNAIKMSFSGLEGLVWASTRVNDDGTFGFKAEKSLMKPGDEGEYKLTVTLGDELQPSGTKHDI